MSQIIFGNLEDLPSIGTPSSGYIVAYDLDGILKQKDVFGNITPIGNTSTYSLDEVLAAGNLSGTYSIIMGTSSIISSANGGGSIHFDYPGASAVSITTDGASYSETYLTLAQDYIKLNYKYSGVSGMLLQAATAGEFLINSPAGTILHVNGTDFIKSAISTFSTPDTAKYSTIVSSRGSKVNNGIVNSVILGGQNLTASTNNTVYVSSLNVNNAYTLPTADGSNGYVLKTDGSGNVTWGSDISTSTWAEVLSTGATSSTDVIISDGDKIKSPNTNVLIDFNNGDKFQAGFTENFTQSFVIASATYSRLEFTNQLSGGSGYLHMSESEYEISASSSISIVGTEVSFGKPSLKNTPLKFYNSTNSNTINLQSGVTTTSYTLTLPTSQGASNTYLKNDGSGNLIWGTQSASSLSDTLLIGNTTSTNIVMTTGHKLVSSVTSPYKVELTMIGGSAARFLLDNESNQTKAWFYGDIDSFESGFNDNYVFADDTKIEMVSTTASNAIQVKFTSDSINNRAKIGVEEGSLKADSIEVVNNSSGGATSTPIDKFPTFISTRGATISTAAYNSVIIGGSAISATQPNTVYLGNFVNINNAYTLPNTDGTAGYVLKTNGSGVVTWQLDDPGPTPSLSQVLDISNTTGTYSINVENYISFDGQGVSQSIDNFASVSPLAGFQYRVTGDVTSAIYTGSIIKVSGTDAGTNDGQFIISNATYSGGYTYFQWSGIQTVIFGPPYGEVSYAREKSYLQVNAASQSNNYNLPNKSGTIALLDDVTGALSGITSSANSGINVTTGTNTIVDTIYNTALDPTLAMPSAVGGLPSGTTAGSLSGMNLVQLFNDILFPTVNPTYTIPTISVSSTVTGIREIGLTVSPTITITGTENDANYFSQLVINRNINSLGSILIATVSASASMTITAASSIVAQFGYADPNNPNFSYSINTSENIQVPAPVSGGSSTIVYSGLGNYTAGVAKKNNKGVTHTASPAVRSTSSPQAGDNNFTANTQTITGYYPYFYGKSATQQTPAQIKTIIESGGATKVVANSAGSLTMGFNAVGEWPWFAIYDSFSTKATWYETALNNGNIGVVIGGPNPDVFDSPTTLSITSPDGLWITNYKIYPSQKVTTISTATIS